MLLSNWAIHSKKKSSFIKIQEASGLLSKLSSRISLSNILLIGHILF